MIKNKSQLESSQHCLGRIEVKVRQDMYSEDYHRFPIGIHLPGSRISFAELKWLYKTFKKILKEK